MHRARRVASVVTALGLLSMTGCTTVVLGRGSPLDPPIDDATDGAVRIVGAVDDPIDDLSRNALADLEVYWGQVLPDEYDQEFRPLAGGYFSVDPGNVDPSRYPGGVGCGADPREVENNAFYCQSQQAPNSDSITYDRAFLGELAAQYGRFLPALVMAHEFGHAIQARVGFPPASIITETQADCMAGAWTAWVANGQAQYSQLREPELDELLRGYFLLRDPVGTGLNEQSAHGSYFDRASAFQEGFDTGAEACRDNFTPDRIFTQGMFTDADIATGGDAPYDQLLGILEESLPTVWNQAFDEVFSTDFREPAIEPFGGTAPGCAADPDDNLVFCSDEEIVGFDEIDLAADAYEIGDFAVATAAAIPYGLAARDQLGLSTDDVAATRSAVCLAGWYAAKVFNGEAGDVTISPGDVDESIQFLLTYGNDPTVIRDRELSGFQLVDLFRNGFVQGLRSCDVGA